MPTFKNSCLTCIAASDDDKLNGYIDVRCNIGYHKGWNVVPFLQRIREIVSYHVDSDEIEAKYPCKYHLTVDEYMKMMEDKSVMSTAIGVIAKLTYRWNNIDKYLIVYTDGIGEDCVMMLDDDKEYYDSITVGDILELCDEDEV